MMKLLTGCALKGKGVERKVGLGEGSLWGAVCCCGQRTVSGLSACGKLKKIGLEKGGCECWGGETNVEPEEKKT